MAMAEFNFDFIEEYRAMGESFCLPRAQPVSVAPA